MRSADDPLRAVGAERRARGRGVRAHRHRAEHHLRRHAHHQLRARRADDAGHVRDVAHLDAARARPLRRPARRRPAALLLRGVPAARLHQPRPERAGAQPDPAHHRARPHHGERHDAGLHVRLPDPDDVLLVVELRPGRPLRVAAAPLLVPHHRRDHGGAVLVPAEHGHRPGHPRHGPGPRGRPAHGHQRAVDVGARLRDRQRPRGRGGHARRAHLLHLPAGGRRVHAQGLRHRRARRHGERARRHARRDHRGHDRVARGRVRRLGPEGARRLRAVPGAAPVPAVRPHGKVAGLTPRETAMEPPTPARSRLTTSNVVAGAVAVAIVVALFAFPSFVRKPYVLNMWVVLFLAVIHGQAWNVVGGYAGQHSIGHAAYFGVGAYVTMMLLEILKVPPWWGIWAGCLGALVLSAIIGSITFRLRGPYFVLASISVAEIIRLAALYFRGFTRGAEGFLVSDMPTLHLFGAEIEFITKRSFYFAGLALALVTILV